MGMTETVLFGSAPRLIVEAAEATGLLLPGCEATLVRDLQGRIKLYLLAPAGQKWPEGTKAQLSALLARFAPYGTSPVYLDTDEAPSRFPFADVVKRDRVPFDTSGLTAAPAATWFRLERRFSKDSWLTETGRDREPWPSESGPPVISFYGYKGGVGRTTALAGFALFLADEYGKNVIVVDLDLEAPGAGQMLLGQAVPDLGVVDFLVEEQLAREVPLALSRFLVGSPLPSGRGSVRVAPAGNLDRDYLEKLGRVDAQGLNGPTSSAAVLLKRLLERIRDEERPDVILLDVRAGLHDLGGISLSGLSHLELIFAVHSEQTWAGLPVVLGHLGRLRAGWVKLVHTFVPPASRGGDVLHEAFVSRAYEVMCTRYYLEGDVPDQMDPDAAHFAYRLPMREALLALSDLSRSRRELLSDEHREFYLRLARETGLTP